MAGPTTMNETKHSASKHFIKAFFLSSNRLRLIRVEPAQLRNQRRARLVAA
jgi:hypothetical protein